jgi:hypothetical protein
MYQFLSASLKIKSKGPVKVFLNHGHLQTGHPQIGIFPFFEIGQSFLMPYFIHFNGNQLPCLAERQAIRFPNAR